MPESDHPRFPDHLIASTDPSASPAGQQGPLDQLPSFERDLQVLAWLQVSQGQLTLASRSYLCGALLEWSMTGEGQLWPDPQPPRSGADDDHLQVLVEITNRWIERIGAQAASADRWELARVGRELSHAIAAQRDPQALAEAQSRELLSRMPHLAWSPAPVRFAGVWL